MQRTEVLLDHNPARRLPSASRTRLTTVYLASGIVLLAALLRFAKLATLPYGLYLDEAYNMIDAQSISWQHHPIFFFLNSGREPLFFYWLKLFLLGMGASTFSMRLASTCIAVLTVALEISVMSRLFNRRIGLLSGIVLATLYCDIQDSRLGLRFNLTPLFTLLLLLTLHNAATRRKPHGAVLVGVVLGVANYTYSSARVMPLIAVAAIIFLAVRKQAPIRQLWVGTGIGGACYALTVAPLGAYFFQHPDALGHMQDLRVVSLDQSIGDNIAAIYHGVTSYVLSFFYEGDTEWLQNISRKPIFDPIMAFMFFIGIGLLSRMAILGNTLRQHYVFPPQNLTSNRL